MLTIFRHDSAHVFLGSLRNSKSPHRLVKSTLEKARGSGEYLEIDDACAALVAAEVIATLRGAPHEDAPSGMLRGSISKHRDSLLDLHELTIQAITQLAHGNNELREAADEIRFQELVEELLSRLSGPANWDRAAEILSFKRPRVRPGDVFRISLGDGRNCFGRMVRKGYFYVYSTVIAGDSTPPIGSRDFLFYALGLWDEIGTAVCPIAGRDPVERRESPYPAVHNGAASLTTIWDLPHPFPNAFEAQAYQCIGMEQLGSVTLPMLRSRVTLGESSVDQSMRLFDPFLTASDKQRALDALAGRKTRFFDTEENRRFMLGTDPQLLRR
jgi:hypothetical protein